MRGKGERKNVIIRKWEREFDSDRRSECRPSTPRHVENGGYAALKTWGGCDLDESLPLILL
jgi:hypothetical protein